MFSKKARIPTPFSRPAIELGGHGKAWQDVTGKDIELGDVIPGFGRVSSLVRVGNAVSAINEEAGTTWIYGLNETVRVFGAPRGV